MHEKTDFDDVYNFENLRSLGYRNQLNKMKKMRQMSRNCETRLLSEHKRSEIESKLLFEPNLNSSYELSKRDGYVNIFKGKNKSVTCENLNHKTNLS